MINSIPYNIQKEKFLRALIYTIFYDELQVCSTNYSVRLCDTFMWKQLRGECDNAIFRGTNGNLSLNS